VGPDAVDPVRAALVGRCPRCGRGRLFAGPTDFATACEACGLEIAAFNVGDGPAAFLILILGFIVVGLAMAFEFGVHPPWWAHAILWPPLVIVLTLVGLRTGKALLLALEYRHDAVEGRRSDAGPPGPGQV
jgi:uncharacterized protein (DUF983 family)